MKKKYLLSFLLLLCFYISKAQSGANCANSILISINGACATGSIGVSDSTQDLPNISGCSGSTSFQRERWYRFIVSSGPQNITITANSQNRNLYLQLISSTSSCTGLTQIACANNDTSNNSSQTETITANLNNGTYYIKVVNVGSTNSNMALNSICVTSPPSNNECTGATTLTVNPNNTCSTSTNGSTIGATQSQSGCVGTADDDVWYSFTATSTAHTITVSPGTLSDAVLQVFSGSCGSLTSLGCVDNTSGSSNETITLNSLTPTTNYYVRVYSYSSNSGNGSFSLCVTTPPNPCSTITNISSCGTTVNTTISSGTGIYSTSSCGSSTFGSELIYSFTPTVTGAYSISQTNSHTTIDYQFKDSIGGCNGTGWNCIGSINGSSTSPTFNLMAGTTYYILLDAQNTTGGNVNFSIQCSPTIPSNDECTNSIPLTVNTTNSCSVTTNGTTVGAIQSQPGCIGNADDDVWYNFTATSTSHIISISAISMNNIVLQVFSGSCGSLTSLNCTNNTTGFSTETTTLTGLTVGLNYYVRIYSNSNGTGQGTFTICVSTPIVPCTAINNISACNTTVNLNVPAGNGFYNTSACGWSTPGNEIIYSYTAPTTGAYSISQTNSFTFIDYQYKLASSGCGATGWTCIDDMTGNATSPTFNLSAGITYYILLDPESNTGGAVTFSINCPAPPLTNDNCSTAIPLSISSDCNYTTYSNAGATASPSIPAPGCASYSGGDIWFTVVVPTNGSVRIDTRQGTITDSGMAIYTGSCGSLNLLECDDDDSSNGLMSMIDLTGLTPGTTLYVRFWEFGNDNNGTFGICVTSPEPCTPGNGLGNTSDGCPNVISGGLGLFGLDPDPLISCNSSGCVDLEATYLTLGSTTSYSVEQISYNPPPYQFNCLTNPVSVNIDDVWSPIINLPFDFCFYGNTYSSCIMGSNGMISFNTASANGSTGWRFDENLPSLDEALFSNTIYGVYHDIDPSKGGEVGWELITLDTGCRALVAAWNDVPMFSNNSILYTGMIILYENTNIIEVYVKEKNIDNFNVSPWNGGNAIIGLQNDGATQAVTAPGRNSLDTNWSVINEAWRFTPSGTTLTSIEWFQGSGTSGPSIGNTNVISVCPTTTTTYTAQVTYNLCTGGTIVITDETTVTVIPNKTWNGSISSDWDNDINWTPVGKPNSSDCVTIPVTANNPIISGSGYNGLAGTLTIHSNATLTVNSGNNITVTDLVDVNTNGNFIIRNNSSLIQINDVTNLGIITYERNASVRTLDYVYWSSPVFNQNINSIFNPIIPGPKYEWNTTIPNSNGGQGNWVLPSTTNMTRGKGYIIRGPSSSPFNNTTTNTLTARFIGTPNNGTIYTPIYRGNDTNTATHYGTNGVEITNLSDNWNLLGNPYPSAIRGSQFLFDNRTKILGSIRLWTHNNLPIYLTNPFYSSFQYNYTASDYLTYNFTGTSCCPAASDELFIGAGQGFFVEMIDGPSTTDVVTFNNNLRSSTYPNNIFYRNQSSSENNQNYVNLERKRIWLDIVNSNNQSSRTLFGYIEGASMEVDNFFDCPTQQSGLMSIYSMISNNKFLIQGRALPFNENDVIPIGVEIISAGNYNIAIAGVDDFFNSRDIYLKDNYNNGIIHNLKTSPYNFTSNPGMHNDRFEIIYTNSTLSNTEQNFENEIKVISSTNLSVISNVEIENIKVFNSLGQKINEFSNIDSKEAILKTVIKNQSTYLLQIQLIDGKIINKKIIF